MDSRQDSPFVSGEWLNQRLGAPDIVVVDGSWYLPAMNRDPEAEYLVGHIPGAIRFDLDAVRDESSPLPHMLPSPDRFAAAVGALAGTSLQQRVRTSTLTYGFALLLAVVGVVLLTT